METGLREAGPVGEREDGGGVWTGLRGVGPAGRKREDGIGVLLGCVRHA